MCRGSESKPMMQNEAKLSDEELEGHYRNKLSLPEREDPDTHTCLSSWYLYSWSSGADVPRYIK